VLIIIIFYLMKYALYFKDTVVIIVTVLMSLLPIVNCAVCYSGECTLAELFFTLQKRWQSGTRQCFQCRRIMWNQILQAQLRALGYVSTK